MNLTGCKAPGEIDGPGPNPPGHRDDNSSNGDRDNNEDVGGVPDGPADTPESPESPVSPNLPVQICPDLNFDGVVWHKDLDAWDRVAIQLGLSISGSFEGHDGWANISNNFDGMGLSLGLLNQNLGSGSLQPLLIDMRNNYPRVLDESFAAIRLKSLLAMLNQWEDLSAFSVNLFARSPSSLHETVLSPLDKYYQVGALAKSAESESVQWAVNTIYNGSSFKPEWKYEFQEMAKAPEYVSVQIEAALGLHSRALRYQDIVGVHDLRSYLLMYDIAVQNGGLYRADIDDFNRYVRENPSLSKEDRLYKLLHLRLRHVREQYRDDVYARKSAIIEGTGLVHGSRRRFEQEYCFDRMLPYPLIQPSPSLERTSHQ